MKVAVLGAGGVGAYFGARLAEAGHEVSFIARGSHLRAIRNLGLTVNSPLGDVHLPGAVATDNPAEVGSVDLVIVAVKTWQLAAAIAVGSPLVGQHTTVLPLLNGVDSGGELSDAWGIEKVVPGSATIFSHVEAPGRISHSNTTASITYGEFDGSHSPRMRHLDEVFGAAGVVTKVSADIEAALWRKLVLVSSWAAIATLARAPLGELRGTPETRALIDASIREGIAAGQASGLDIAPGLRLELWDLYDSLPADATSSMQRDIMAGRPSELDAWNGAVVRVGAWHGCATPTHELAYNLLLPQHRNAQPELATGQVQP